MDSLVAELRKYRIFKMAIFDWVLALLGGFILAAILYKYWKPVGFWLFLILMQIAFIIFGIFVHKILGIDTQLGYYLGINPKLAKKNI